MHHALSGREKSGWENGQFNPFILQGLPHDKRLH
jgi:hypothetical protein